MTNGHEMESSRRAVHRMNQSFLREDSITEMLPLPLKSISSSVKMDLTFSFFPGKRTNCMASDLKPGLRHVEFLICLGYIIQSEVWKYLLCDNIFLGRRHTCVYSPQIGRKPMTEQSMNITRVQLGETNEFYWGSLEECG